MRPPKIPIFCAYSRLEPLSALKPHPDNPKKHPARQIAIFANILQETGWRRPIIVSKRSGFIVAGHGASMAAESLGIKNVPVDFQDFPDDQTELAFLSADNRIAELAELDEEAAGKLIAEIPEGMRDLTAFDEKERNLLAWVTNLEDPKKRIPGGDGSRVIVDVQLLQRDKAAALEKIQEVIKTMEGVKILQ